MNSNQLNLPSGLSRRTVLGRAATIGAALGLSGIAATGAQEDAPAAVELVPNVVFGEVDGEQLVLDIALPPEDATPRPAVVILHGGGLMFGDKEGFSQAAMDLAIGGYATFNVNYRLFTEEGKNTWPAQLDDAQRAVRWVRAHAATYGVDPERVAAYGGSSGGQLAAFLGTRETRDNSDSTLAEFSSRVQCVVDLAGGMDMTTPSANAEENALNAAVLGGTAEAPPSAAAYQDFSPITFVDEQTVPFLILHGLDDVDAPIEQSRMMTAALQEAGIEVFAAELDGLAHRDIGNWVATGPLTLAFLGRQMPGATGST